MHFSEPESCRPQTASNHCNPDFRDKTAGKPGATLVRLADRLNPQPIDPKPQFQIRPSSPSSAQPVFLGSSCNYSCGCFRRDIIAMRCPREPGVSKIAPVLARKSPLSHHVAPIMSHFSFPGWIDKPSRRRSHTTKAIRGQREIPAGARRIYRLAHKSTKAAHVATT